MTDRPEIRILTVPKWFLPVLLFVVSLALSAVVVLNQDKWAFGSIFGLDAVKAQESYPDYNKFGVNSASWTVLNTEAVVRNSAALSGPGGSIVGIVAGTDAGWVGGTKEFIQFADMYCLTPVLRLEVDASKLPPAGWGSFFEQIGGNGGKMVIVIGNEVNHRDEWSGSGADYARYLNSTIDAIRPHVGGAKILGAPLNTSAPGDSVVQYWKDFVMDMKEVGGWEDKLDGHASNPYPVNGLPVTLYNDEMEEFGYSKPVYIIEIGPHGSVPQDGTFLSPQQFMNDYWGQYCGDGNVVMANFFNAAGNNPSSDWTGGIGNFVFSGSETWSTSCNIGDTSALYNANGTNNAGDSCVIVPRSEYRPMESSYGGGDGTQGSRCVAADLTSLVPDKREYSKRTEIQLSNGSGGIYGTISVKEVTVADMFQNQDVERTGDTPVGTDMTAEFKNTQDFDVFYEVPPNYPADGVFNTWAIMGVLSWPNENCVANELESPWVPIATSWACTGATDPEYTWSGDGSVTPATHYVEVPPEGGVAYLRVKMPMYFPLGTALGSIPDSPYNTGYTLGKVEDFKRPPGKASYYNQSFVGNQTPTIEYGTESIFSQLTTWLGGILGNLFKFFGVEAVINDDVRLENVDVSTVKVNGGSLPMTYAFSKDVQAGEQDIPLPEVDYMQNCEALDEVLAPDPNHNKSWKNNYDAKIWAMENKKKDECGYIDQECIENGGEPDECYHEDSGCVDKWNGIIDEANVRRGRLEELLKQCTGEAPRPIKINGYIEDVKAPFVQILAYQRLEQTILMGDTICNPPEEELYAAKVSLNVKWFDKNQSGGGGGDYLTCPTGNLLNNGSFETTGGAPGGTASGRIPEGWSAMWKKSSESACANDALSYCKAPEFKPIDAGVDERRVLDGSLASLYFSAFNTHDTILFQEVSVTPGQSLDLSGYAQQWRSSEGNTENGCAMSDLPVDGSFSQICVVDTSAISLPAELPEVPVNVWDDFINKLETVAHCTEKKTELDTWNSHNIDGISSNSGSVYVFLRGYAHFPQTNTDDYWDNVCLVESGNLQIQSRGEIQERARRSATQSSKCEAVNWPETSCSISIERTGGDLLLDEDLTFYMPGLGVYPSLVSSISMGDAKSTDREASQKNFCYLRDVSQMPFGNKDLSGLSALDVYIYQNLYPPIADKWIKQIWPEITSEALEFLGSAPAIEDAMDVDWLPEDCEGGNHEYEELIAKRCKDYGLTSEETAYVLATALGECSVTPISEYGCYSGGCDGSGVCNWRDDCGCEPIDGVSQRNYGCPDPVTGQQYYGRGFVQLTHKSNYNRANIKLRERFGDLDLVNNPEKVLKPDIAAEILVRGMNEGWFTGKKLSDYIDGTTEGYVEARRIVNGTFRAESFAKKAMCYLENYPNL